MEKVDDIINEIDNTGEEIFAVKLSDFCGVIYTKTEVFSLLDEITQEKFKNFITVVKQKEDGTFEEFYTGLSASYMKFSEFKQKYGKKLTESAFFQTYYELCKNGYLFFADMYPINDEVKARIFEQQDYTISITEEIFRIYNKVKDTLKEECKSKLNSFLGVAYGENLLYDFKHGINRTRKIDITDKKE